MRDEYCTDNQLSQLQELFPLIDDLFDEFEDENERPYIKNFYRYLFAAYQASFDYITAFDHLVDRRYTDEFLVIDAFKRTMINRHILNGVHIIYKALNILLGDMCDKKFSLTELINKFDYPDIEDEKLEAFNKKWCRINGVNYQDFRKIKNYI